MATPDNHMQSMFDCKLNPSRVQSLLDGYARLCIQTYVTIDIIKCLISYFNEILYWDRSRQLDDTKAITLEYKINNVVTFQFIDYISTFQVKFESNLSAMHTIGHVVFRMRLFAFDESAKEFNKICHIDSQSSKIPFETKCKFNKSSIIGLEIELLHFQYTNNKLLRINSLLDLSEWKFWTKWRYPFNADKFDEQLYNNDPYFKQEFEKICFGVQGRYYLLHSPQLSKLRALISDHAQTDVKIIKYGYLSKFKDIFVSTDDNATGFCPKFENLHVHHQRIKAAARSKVEQYRGKEDRMKKLPSSMRSLSDYYTDKKNAAIKNLNTLKIIYQSILRFHSVAPFQRRFIIDMISVGQYEIIQSVSNVHKSIAVEAVPHSQQHHHRNRYDYFNRKAIQRNKTYRNNKKKHQYHRW